MDNRTLYLKVLEIVDKYDRCPEFITDDDDEYYVFMGFISNDIEDRLENQREELYPIYTKIIEELLQIDDPSIEDAFYTDIFRDLYVSFGKKNPITL